MPRSPDRSEDYDVRPSKIRLKTTKSERAEKIFAREKRRFEKDQHRISRANGYAVSPPPSSSSRNRAGSISPPRNKPRPQAKHYEEEEGQEGEWLGAMGRKVKEERWKRERAEWEGKMRWMAGEEGGGGGLEDWEDLEVPRWGYAGRAAESLPSRWRSAPSRPFLSPSLFPPPPSPFEPGSRPTRPKMYHFPSQPPPMGAMSEDDYADYIRTGMYAQKHASALLEADRKKTERMEKEAKRERERERREKEEERWRRKQEKEEWERYRRRAREREEAEDAYRPVPPPRESATPPYRSSETGQAKTGDPAKWKARWDALQAGGEIESSNLSFNDIPWPIFLSNLPSTHTPDDVLSALSLENVKKYMVTVASYKENTGGEPGKVRRVVREAVRSFHPDRFTVRVLGRVREGDKGKVKEGADVVSRVLNDLARQYK
ncbi:hypothetical protein L202_00874 [Cryptococcus amylolentus CBS 6039]|uniref:Uncharacterized protein n=1 Tax=Cryptococcus amylolentus CBS 6039 TaxID=1295533 RepID=A0A1E3I8Y0_9TREE|nr:hypothetical protein L202_00874 [Cryptococcus amylolentus CBS 6039]ODN85044.1 hypothetical protein L202_00874 [Cryptococcus amylolentus CBS 6039]